MNISRLFCLIIATNYLIKTKSTHLYEVFQL